MLDGNITIDSCNDIGGCRSIVLIDGYSVPSREADNGHLYVDLVHRGNGPLPHCGSIFVVWTSDGYYCIYSKNCNDLWNLASCYHHAMIHMVPLFVCDNKWTLIHDCASKIMASICDKYCCYKEDEHGTFACFKSEIFPFNFCPISYNHR